MMGGLIWMIFSSPAVAGAPCECGVTSAVGTGAGSGRATWTGGGTGFVMAGARIIFEIGGSTDLGFASELDSSGRFDLFSSISETVSGLGGGGGGVCDAG